MTNPENDRIERKIVLSAPRARVWRALSDAAEFGQWFRVRLEGAFHEGTTVVGQITYPGYEHLGFEMQVVELVPERYFSYRWRPNAIDPNRDYSAEPMTLVEFTLEDVPGAKGTLLTIVESGFSRLPADRRAEAFRSNDGGWAEQLKNIERHVGQS
ncbi:MAG TPA: SRPBCC family protein [Polyangiaceae bacterium]|nr:SRPBCC family protein [Polyangiaceae bacterium]